MNQEPKREIFFGGCPHDCPDTCAMLFEVEDGILKGVKGNPEHPMTRGVLCVKLKDYEKMKDRVLTEQKNRFRPEFLNRIDASVVFHSLGRDELRQIVDLMLDRVSVSLKDKNIAIEVTETAKDLLGTKGYDPVFGARPLRRVIQNMLEDQLSDAILRGEFVPGDTIEIDSEDDRLVMRPLVGQAVS